LRRTGTGQVTRNRVYVTKMERVGRDVNTECRDSTVEREKTIPIKKRKAPWISKKNIPVHQGWGEG